MKKSMRYWSVGIILILIYLIIAIFEKASGFRDSSIESSKNSVSVPTESTSVADSLTRYLSKQEEIYISMIETMKNIKKTGNASIDFLNGMILHHQSTIQIAENYLSYGSSNKKLQNIAETSISSKKEQISQIKDLIIKYESQNHNSEDKENAYLEDYNALLNQELQTEESVKTSLDLFFADNLIKQDHIAIEMANSILEYTDYGEIRNLAKNIINTRKKEIDKIQELTQ